MGEPVRVLGHPRMVGGGLQSQVKRYFHVQFASTGDEVIEVGQGAQVRVDRVMTAGSVTDGPW